MDFDYFYAQCEMIRNPLIANKPVVVIMQTIRENVGAVATCNYKARELKIRSGMSLALAKKLANDDTVFLKADKEHYQNISDKIFLILDKYSENVEQVSIDEAYFDLSKNNSFEKAKEVCQKLKDEIYSETQITCSIGISTNKLVAKIASKEKKPNGLFLVKDNEINDFLIKKSVKDLPGIGPKSEKLLNKNNIKTIFDLQKISKDNLIDLFGKAKGILLFEFARGIDNRVIDSNREKKQISRLITMKEDTLDFEIINKNIEFLCERVFRETISSKKKFRTVSLILIDIKNNNITKSVTLQNEISSSDELKEIQKELLNNILKESIIKFKRVGVRVSNFSKGFGYQKKLFDFGK